MDTGHHYNCTCHHRTFLLHNYWKRNRTQFQQITLKPRHTRTYNGFNSYKLWTEIGNNEWERKEWKILVERSLGNKHHVRSRNRWKRRLKRNLQLTVEASNKCLECVREEDAEFSTWMKREGNGANSKMRNLECVSCMSWKILRGGRHQRGCEWRRV